MVAKAEDHSRCGILNIRNDSGTAALDFDFGRVTVTVRTALNNVREPKFAKSSGYMSAKESTRSTNIRTTSLILILSRGFPKAVDDWRFGTVQRASRRPA